MATKKKITPFLLYEGRCADDNHVRITEDMLLSPAFLGLPSGAKTLYLYMKAWAHGRESVTYAATMAGAFMAKPAYYRARDELINAGFIYWVNKAAASCQKNETSIFEFVDTWHTGNRRSEPK